MGLGLGGGAVSKESDSDFVMLAPPCGPWSQIQLMNQRTPLQIRDLQRRREVARALLAFFEKVVHYQHHRGRAAAVVNPKTSCSGSKRR